MSALTVLNILNLLIELNRTTKLVVRNPRVVFDLLDKQTSTLKLLQQLYWQRRDPTEAEISRVENDVSTAQKQMHEALENLHKSQ